MGYAYPVDRETSQITAAIKSVSVDVTLHSSKGAKCEPALHKKILLYGEIINIVEPHTLTRKIIVELSTSHETQERHTAFCEDRDVFGTFQYNDVDENEPRHYHVYIPTTNRNLIEETLRIYEASELPGRENMHAVFHILDKDVRLGQYVPRPMPVEGFPVVSFMLKHISSVKVK